MKQLLFLFFFITIFFYHTIFTLTIVAKVNPQTNALYLDQNDPHREKIIDILYKYQWPVSLLECTDEERNEIFKDDLPFSETIYIQKKIREATQDNSYVALWIPPLVSQAYTIYLYDFNTENAKEFSTILFPEFYKTIDITVDYLPFFIETRSRVFSIDKTDESKKRQCIIFIKK